MWGGAGRRGGGGLCGVVSRWRRQVSFDCASDACLINADIATNYLADKIHKPDANGRTPGAVDVLQVTDTITGDNYFFRFPCVAEMSAQKAQQTLKDHAPATAAVSSSPKPAAPAAAAKAAAAPQRVPQQTAHSRVAAAAALKRKLLPARAEMKVNLAEAHVKVMQLERANEQLQATLHNVEAQLVGLFL